MSLPIIASSLSLLASLSGADMSTTFSPETKLEANRIGVEQCGTEAKQNVAFTMGKQVDERVAINKPVESRGFASLPQAERTQSATLAVYQDNQGKQAPMLAINAIQLENGTRIEDKQWSTAYASPERTERGLA
jgi:hypothetical protein